MFLMNSLYYIASYLRIIPKKAYSAAYNYYCGIESYPTERMETIPKYHSLLNHVSSLYLEPTEIIPGIYLGNAYNASNYLTLKYYNINHILNISTELANVFPDMYNYLKIPVKDDNQNHIYEYIPEIIEFLDKINIGPENAVLIHCYMGSSRSASVVLLYLIHKYRFSYEHALQLIKNKRPIVNINKNFLEDIRAYFDEDASI